MKKLSRMLLIHWHNYEKELIDFDMINFLTGKTAAGKSTIIDALQLVLLGDTGGAFFNKAANQKSARTLKSYLFGAVSYTHLDVYKRQILWTIDILKPARHLYGKYGFVKTETKPNTEWADHEILEEKWEYHK